MGRYLIPACWALVLTLCGCLIVPLPEREVLAGRGVIDEEVVEGLRNNLATREDVLQRLGPPDVSLRNDRIFVYSWDMSAGTFATPTAVGPVPRNHRVVIEFDQDGRMRSTDVREKWGGRRPDIGTLLRTYSAEEPDSMQWKIVIDPVPEVWAHLDAPKGAGPRKRVVVGEFEDVRTRPYSGTLLGRHWLGYRMENAEIHSRRPISELVRACVISQLKDSGFEISDKDGDRALTGKVEVLLAEGTTEVLKPIVNEVRFDISIEGYSVGREGSIVRRYTNAQREEKCVYVVSPLDADACGRGMERVIRSSFETLQEQIASDRELMEFLRAGN